MSAPAPAPALTLASAGTALGSELTPPNPAGMAGAGVLVLIEFIAVDQVLPNSKSSPEANDTDERAN